MIEKKSIFELIGGSTTKYHSAILTTYTFDPIYFSTYYLSKLKSCGITNIIVMVDSSNYDVIMQDYAKYGSYLSSSDYTIVRQQPSSGGVFHPKICMLIGQRQGLMFVGSSNLTYSGQSVNEEVWGCIWLTDEESPYKPLFGRMWNYLSSVIVKSTLVSQQMDWMKEYSDWLDDAVSQSSDNITTPEREDVSLLFNDYGQSIYSQLRNYIGDAKVREIDVVAPFYDERGSIITSFRRDYQPSKLKSVVYKDGTYPAKMVQSNPQDFAEWKADDNQKERLHAKIYEFKTDKGSFILIGSVNATPSAFGLNSSHNDEAAILLHENANRNYLGNLGISLNVGKIDTDNFKEGSRLDDTDKDMFDVLVTSAEIIDGTLYLQASKDLTGFEIGLLDVNGELIGKVVPSENGQVQVGNYEGIRMVIIMKDDKEFSNKYLVMDDSTVARCNPNPAGHKLTSLFNSGSHWDDNIARILEFVSFDMPTENKRNATVSIKSGKHNSSKEDDVITKDQFDDISTGSRYHILSLNNIRIVDYLCKFIGNPETEESTEEADSNVTDEERQNGVNDSGENNYLEDLRSSDEKEESAILNYLRKFDRHMDDLLSPFYSEFEEEDAEKENPPRRKPKMGKNKAGLNEYSSALILIALIYQILCRNMYFNTNIYKMRQFLVSALGRFLLYYHDKSENTGDYRYRKICSMYRDLTIFTLLSISKMDFPKDGNYYWDIRVLILNLFDFYYDNKQELKEVMEKFKAQLHDDDVSHNAATVAMIESLYNDFMKFSRNNKEQIDDDWDYAIEWGSSNGFAYRDEFKKSTKLPGQYISRYIPCGYHEGCFRIETGKTVILFE